MDDSKVDTLIEELSAPMFIYRMAKPVVDDPDNYDPRLVKGAQTKIRKARQEIVEVISRMME